MAFRYGTALLAGIAWCGSGAAESPPMPLREWRAEIRQTRALAENNAAQAAMRAARLAAAMPSGAEAADRVALLNVQGRIAMYQARTALAASLTQQARQEAEHIGDRTGQAEADLTDTLNMVNQGRFERLTAVSSHAVDILDGVDRPDLRAEAMLRLAMAYTRFGKLEEGADACLRTLDMARRSGLPMALAYGHQCVATTYGVSENYAQAEAQYSQMYVHASAASSRLMQAQALAGRSTSLAAQGNAAAAETLIRQVQQMYSGMDMPFYLANSMFAEAHLLRLRGQRQGAATLLGDVQAIYERHDNHTGLWWVLTTRGADYMALNRLPAARADLQRASEFARELNLPSYIGESERLLGHLAAREGDHRGAYAHAVTAAETSAQMNRRKVGKRVQELTERFRQEARQREITDLVRRNGQQQAELRERSMQQRWLWSVLAIIAAALALLSVFLLRLRRSHRMLAAANGQLHQSRAALERQTGILQSVLDSMSEGVAVTDEAGHLVLVNPTAERIVGMTRCGGQVVWPADAQFYHPDRVTPYPRRALPLARMLRRVPGATADAGERGAAAEVYMERGAAPDRRWLHMTARPLAGPQAGAVTVISDITERKQAEEEIHALNTSLESTVQLRTAQLRQQTRYLRVLIDTIPWCVWFKDTNSRYLAANRAAAAALGTECGQLIGQSDFDVKPPAIAGAWRDEDLRVMTSRRPQTVEELQDGPQGPVWMETFKAPVFDDDGAVLGTVGLARDVSARKQAETARDQALLEAQRLAQLRSDFLAHMSHELRTPLHAVLGFVQLLRRGGGLAPEQLSSVDAIGHSGEHLQGLINNVLDSAQLEAGKILLVPQPVELAPFLNGIITMMQGRAADKGLEFRWTVDDGLPGILMADEQRLRQVLLNLLSNAIKFTDRGGVTLALAGAGAQRLRFSVQDSGVGITPGELDTIFQPFEQAGDASRRAAGTGLGLAICRQLVRLMGSEIQVESQAGSGSRFWFELAAPEHAMAHEAPPLVLAACAAAEPLTPPPPPLLQDLLHLVRIGNMRTILAFAQALEQQEPRYAAFAARVSRLAQHYQSQALRQLVEDHLQ